MDRDQELLKELLEIFGPEAEEHLTAISSALIELEKATAGDRRQEIIETAYREVHSLKGAARSVNLSEVESICQGLEGVFASLKRGERDLSRELFDRFHAEMDSLGALLGSYCGGEAATGQSRRADPETVAVEAPGPWAGRSAPSEPPSLSAVDDTSVRSQKASGEGEALSSIPVAHSETVRISKSRQDALLLQVEELLGIKLAAARRNSELREISGGFDAWKKEWSDIYPDLQVMNQVLRDHEDQAAAGWRDAATRLIDFLHGTFQFMGSQHGALDVLAAQAEHDQRALSGITDELLEGMKMSLMLPASSSLAMLPKFVRDLSREQGKEVSLAIEGGEIEIDRRIMEGIKDPILHLVRNCIDHGIEKPEERTAKGKAPAGALTISISPRDGSKVDISISDDGAGIEPGGVREAAIKARILSKDEAEKLGEQEVIPFVFKSGVTTSPIITTISGRGLGLAIVKERAEMLDGTVSLESRAGAGATFRITLPLSRATYRGVLVRTGDHHFVAPSLSVERVIRVREEDISAVGNKEIVHVGGETIPFVRLSDVMEIGRESGRAAVTGRVLAMVLASAGRRIAFCIDEVIREQEVLVKGLGGQLSRVRNISGATLLGMGKLVPVLNVPDLMKSAMVISEARFSHEHEVKARPATKEKMSILVVEDSITSRVLLKNVLEGAGYMVTTAVDGLDGFTRLRTEPFQLVVSDVEMPRMNGFELTAKIRSDKLLCELPVVLVTALESREDRERGIEVGANAYIAKRGFDQNNLLQVIERLI